MLALGSPEGFAPAKGLPTPSSASSRTAPDASRSRSNNLVFGRLMVDVTSHGSSRRREDDAGYLLTIATSPAGRIAPVAKVMITPSSPVLLSVVSDQPERSQSATSKHASSTHSSAVETSEPIHITSLMTAAAPAAPSAMAGLTGKLRHRENTIPAGSRYGQSRCRNERDAKGAYCSAERAAWDGVLDHANVRRSSFWLQKKQKQVL